MIDPHVKAQLELGALRIAYKSLLMHVARMSAPDAAGAQRWLDAFTTKTLQGAENFNINIEPEVGVTQAEARKLVRESVAEAISGIKFSND